MGIDNLPDPTVESLQQLTVIDAHADQRLDFRLRQLVKPRIVVPFIGSAGDPHHRTGHALQRVPHRIDVGRFRIVDVGHAVDLPALFEAVLDPFERPERPAYRIRPDPGRQGRQRSGHRIISIMHSLNFQFRNRNLHPFPGNFRTDHAIGQHRRASVAGFHAERQGLHPERMLRQVSERQRIVGANK